MKTFNKNLFCSTLSQIREVGKLTQARLAEKLQINRSSLSLYENGKQLPDIDLLSRVCALSGKNASDFFTEQNQDGLFYFMGKMDSDSDRQEIESLIQRIQIKEKYTNLNRRG